VRAVKELLLKSKRVLGISAPLPKRVYYTPYRGSVFENLMDCANRAHRCPTRPFERTCENRPFLDEKRNKMMTVKDFEHSSKMDSINSEIGPPIRKNLRK
jgi:hypothetical protein